MSEWTDISQDTNDLNWELELTGMRKPATCGGIYVLKNGQDANINFFKICRVNSI